MSDSEVHFGSMVSLTTKEQIRFEGKLFASNAPKGFIVLSDVRAFGTEDRHSKFSVAPTNAIYANILFPSSKVADIHVLANTSNLVPLTQVQKGNDPKLETIIRVPPGFEGTKIEQLKQQQIKNMQKQHNKLQQAKEEVRSLEQQLRNMEVDYKLIESNHKQQIAMYAEKTEELEYDAANLRDGRAEMQVINHSQLVQLQQLQNELESEKLDKKLLANTLRTTQEQCQQYSETQRRLEDKIEELSNKSEAQLQQMQLELKSLHAQNKEHHNLLAMVRRRVLEAVSQATQDKQAHLNCYEQALQNITVLQGLLLSICSAGPQPTELLVHAVLMGQQLVQLQLQGAVINGTTSDIQTGQTVYEEILSMARPVQCLCAALQYDSKASVASADEEVTKLRGTLSKLHDQLVSLKGKAEAKSDLGDMVQNELADMDKAIAEATQRFVELLSETRRNDEGIKLEVNGKILDACTSLMECIKQLIERSRNLQEEIVSIGRGSTSVKEFYTRNSQWTEGLISAAKSVAKGANLLLNAADKATSVDTPISSEYFQILVAAQEIAAYTAQLVVASKVKAPKSSERLAALQQASRSVSHATGAVVATVRDCNKFLEQPEPIDITKLNSSQAKTMDMEIHVRVLELEQALEMERRKLASFRRNNYMKTED